jgi:hypothetical protein
MALEDTNEIITMINTRGRVVRVRRWEVSFCKEQGMKVIINPKQEYYYEYDSENQRSIPLTDNIAENITNSQLLEVEAV